MERRRLLQWLAMSPLLLSPLCAGAAAPARYAYGNLPNSNRIRRVIPSGPAAAILMLVLAPDLLASWPNAISPELKPYLPRTVHDLPVSGHLGGRSGSLSAEALLAIAPQMILDIGNASEQYRALAERVNQQTHIAYVLMEGHLSDSPWQFRQLGRMLGRSARAERLAQYCERLLHRAMLFRQHSLAAERPRVYYGRGADGLETGADGSIHIEAINLAGARNVALNAGGSGLARVTQEQVLAWNPQIILTQDERFFDILQRGVGFWHNTEAVRHKRIYKAPSLPFGWLDLPPGVNRLLGVSWTMDKLRTHGKSRLEADVDEFYRLFYGVELSAAQIRKFLHNG